MLLIKTLIFRRLLTTLSGVQSERSFAPQCIIIFPGLVFARGLRKATSSVVVAPDSAS